MITRFDKLKVCTGCYSKKVWSVIIYWSIYLRKAWLLNNKKYWNHALMRLLYLFIILEASYLDISSGIFPQLRASMLLFRWNLCQFYYRFSKYSFLKLIRKSKIIHIIFFLLIYYALPKHFIAFLCTCLSTKPTFYRNYLLLFN